MSGQIQQRCHQRPRRGFHRWRHRLCPSTGPPLPVLTYARPNPVCRSSGCSVAVIGGTQARWCPPASLEPRFRRLRLEPHRTDQLDLERNVRNRRPVGADAGVGSRARARSGRINAVVHHVLVGEVSTDEGDLVAIIVGSKSEARIKVDVGPLTVVGLAEVVGDVGIAVASRDGDASPVPITYLPVVVEAERSRPLGRQCRRRAAQVLCKAKLAGRVR